MRFNSSWNGYSDDFKELTYDSVIAIEDEMTTLALPAYGVVILSQD